MFRLGGIVPIMRRFVKFWWLCARNAFWGNAAFANDWQWLIGYPATAVVLWLVAYSYAEWSGRIEVTLTTAGLGALAAAFFAYLITWAARFIVRFWNAPVELYYEEKDRADKLEGLRQIANDATRAPSFEIGFDLVPEIIGVQLFEGSPDHTSKNKDICRIWVENREPRHIIDCRVVIENIHPATADVNNGDALIRIEAPYRPPQARFDIAPTEKVYFTFLENVLGKIHIHSGADSGSFYVERLLRYGGLKIGGRYFLTIAVHGKDAGSRRINLTIDVKNESEAVVSESEKRNPVNEIARLRTRETEIRNEPVKSDADFESWKTRMNALREDIAREIEACSSSAQVNLFRTIGNLRHSTPHGIEVFNPEHDMLVRIATRDLDWLDEFITSKVET